MSTPAFEKTDDDVTTDAALSPGDRLVVKSDLSVLLEKWWADAWRGEVG